MKIGGVWVGLGLGDSSQEVRTLKAFMRKKFASYAGHLDDTELYDEQMVEAVIEMQTRYGVPATGIIDYKTKVTMGYVKVAPPPKPTLFTVSGTGVPWWMGPDADIARACEAKWYWQPVGYPAHPFPMAPSVAAGRAELCRLISDKPGPFALVGYSQGAIICSQVFKYDLAPGGQLHHRLPDLQKAVMIGNPYRQQGIRYPLPKAVGTTSHGISDDRLENTPDWWWEFAHTGDIYTDTPPTDAGEYMTAIYKIVQSQWWGGPDSILSQVFELVQRPVVEVFAMVQAITNGILFAASGTRPHITYPIAPAVDFLMAEQLAAA